MVGYQTETNISVVSLSSEVACLQLTETSLAEWLVLLTAVHEIPGMSPTEGRIQHIIAPDKTGYPHISFLISAQKDMLWVLIRSISVRHF